jgi:hypothetical protein
MKYVKYIGTSHVRQITKDEWAGLDPAVENETVRWHVGNGWTVPASVISDDAWPYIEADSELVIIDKDYRGMSDEDRPVEADTIAYPPLTTAQEAETTPELQPVVVEDDEDQPEEEQSRLPDQESGSKSVDSE